MQPNNQLGGFIPFIHIVRGIAPLLVLWSHLVGLWIYENPVDWEPWIAFYNYFMLPFHLYQGAGHLGVILFFLISGYVISHVAERETRFEFLVKRLFRIMPPLFVAVGILYLLNAILINNTLPLISGTNSTLVKDYILTATLLDRFIYATSNSLSVTWTLAAEFWFYGMTLILLPFLNKKPVACTVFMMFMYMALTSPVIMAPYFAKSLYVTVYIPIFFIGRLIFLKDRGKISGEALFILCSASALLFIGVHEAKWPGELFKGPIIKVFTYPTAILIFMGLQAMDMRRVPKILNFFGDISYSLYLLHIPIGFFIITTTIDDLGYPVSLCLATSVTILASWVSYRMIEKPCQKVARKVIQMVKFE
jgi:peptidoglycan/LPS O-acetylase OafA/YrhL